MFLSVVISVKEHTNCFGLDNWQNMEGGYRSLLKSATIRGIRKGRKLGALLRTKQTKHSFVLSIDGGLVQGILERDA